MQNPIAEINSFRFRGLTLTQNETVLTAQATNGTQIFNATIETFTSSSLVYSYTQVDASSGVTYRYKVSLGH